MDNEHSNSIWIGLLMSLVGQTGANYGMLVQKQALNEGKVLAVKWWIGLVLFCVFEIITSSALYFASASIISTLQSYQLVCNAFLAPAIIPGEKLSKKTGYGCLILIIFCICAVFSHPDQGATGITIDKLKEFFGRTWVILLLVFLGTTFVALSTWSFLLIRKGKAPKIFSLALLASIAATSTTLCLKAMFLVIKHADASLIILLIIMTLIISIGSFGFTNVALNYYEALSVVPIFNSLTQVMRVIVAGLLFDEFINVSGIRLFCFFSCVTFIVTSTFLLSLFTTQEKRISSTDRAGLLLDEPIAEDEILPPLSTAHSVRETTQRFARSISRDFLEGAHAHVPKEKRETLVLPSAVSLITANLSVQHTSPRHRASSDAGSSYSAPVGEDVSPITARTNGSA